MYRLPLGLGICLLTLSFAGSSVRAADPKPVEAILLRWQTDCAKVWSIACTMDVWENNPPFKTNSHTRGRFEHTSPSNWLYRIDFKAVGDKVVPKQGVHLIIDQGIIYEFRHADRVLVEHRWPLMEARPLEVAPAQTLAQFWLRPLRDSHALGTLIFHPNAAELQKRYAASETTTDAERKRGEVWLALTPKDKYPAPWSRIDLILVEHDLEGAKLLYVYGVRLHWGNNQANTTHVFKDCRFNATNPATASSFDVNPPPGWKYEIDELPARDSRRKE